MQPLPFIFLLLLPSCLSVDFIWQITDIHVDGGYLATGAPERSTCREDAGAEERWYGQRLCGLPWRTVQSAVDTMKRTIPDARAVLWTGDTAPHWPYRSWVEVYPKLRRVSAMLRTAFPDAAILPAIGNHDAYPSDQFENNATFYHEYLERSGWTELLPESAQRTFRRGGYYSVDVSRDLRVIVLNTALYYNKNMRLLSADPDPAGQLAWLRAELEDRQRPTIVTAHISPGFPHWDTQRTSLKEIYNEKLLEILTAPQSGQQERIANIFGHEHIDTFQNVYRDRDDLAFEKHTYALNTFFMAPALIPGTLTQDVNPSIRSYALNGPILNDYVQQHFDLEEANAAHRRNSSINPADFWKVTYRAREAYELSDLTPRSMHLLFKMVRDDDQVFRKYMRFTGGMHGSPHCDDTCKRKRLCVMSNAVPKMMRECLNGGSSVVASMVMVVMAAGLVARLG